MVKMIITNDYENIGIIKDFSDLDKEHMGLLGQVITELEILKEELVGIYLDVNGRDYGE